MYNIVAPTVNEKVTINVPNHLPNKKPPIRNIGLPNPKSKTQIIVNKINDKLKNNKFEPLKALSESVFFFIISKLDKSLIENLLKNSKRNEIIIEIYNKPKNNLIFFAFCIYLFEI